MRIIDTHIHLFDPTRPQGVPWPLKTDRILYQPALPARYRRITGRLGVVGAIAVEASPWLEDNQWLLDQAARNSIIVGVIGDLEPGNPAFRKQLERFGKSPLFRGIRYGNLWQRDLDAKVGDANFIADLKVMAGSGLVLDTANPNAALVRAVLRLSDKVPDLRIVLDHLPNLAVPAGSIAQRNCEADIRELGKRPQIYAKISEVVDKLQGRIPKDLSAYRSVIDPLWEAFGENHLLYGSDWPNSDHWSTYQEVLDTVSRYFMAKGRPAAEKYFWKNSIAAYRWVRRA